MSSSSTPPDSFGELNLWGEAKALPSEEKTPKVFGVGELTRMIRGLLEKEVGSIWIEGEISNYRRQTSGHQYFTLKDESAQIACVFFRGNAATGTSLADGMQVELYGEISVYEARGQYQLIVRKVSMRGAGALQAKFEALKTRLQAEGLFDSERKRALPAYPKRIGIVTSPTGAALQDFLRVLKSRMSAEIIIAPVRVQGTGASREIAAAIEQFADEKNNLGVDVIALIRGGGSLEDLWEFNEEIVARAIVNSPVPVITGVGHEIDFTIADFAADFRAPTPSAAAMALLPEKTDIQHRLSHQVRRLQQTVIGQHRLLLSQLHTLSRSGVFREPARRIEEKSQQLDDLFERMRRGAFHHVRGNRLHLSGLLKALSGKRPTHTLNLHRHQLAACVQRLHSRCENLLEKRRVEVQKLHAMLKAFSPEATLERGFTMTTDEKGNPVVSIKQAKKLDSLTTVFRDGKIRSKPTS